MTDFLADTSAVVRFLTGDAHRHWERMINAGRVGICPPVEAELVNTARNWADFESLQSDLRAAFAWHPLPDAAWRTLSQTQRDLVMIGQHRGPSLADLLVAATAVGTDLDVLHDDRDFETIAKVQPIRLHRVNRPPTATARSRR